jgi:hypothetical protein
MSKQHVDPEIPIASFNINLAGIAGTVAAAVGSDDRPEISLSYQIEPTSTPIAPTAPAREKVSVASGMLSILSFFAFFIPHMSIVSVCVGVVSCIVGAVAAKHDWARIIFIFGILLVPAAFFARVILSASP